MLREDRATAKSHLADDLNASPRHLSDEQTHNGFLLFCVLEPLPYVLEIPRRLDREGARFRDVETVDATMNTLGL